MAVRRVGVQRGPGAARFQWTEELLAMLGKRPDAEVAELAGIHVNTVKNERWRRSIPGFGTRRPAIDWTDEMVALLGTDADARVAAELGIHRSTVTAKRLKLGIPPYCAPTYDGPRGYAWPRKALARLGKVPDREIAEILGVSMATVARKRHELGMEAYRPTPPRIRWTAEEISLLGAMTDREVAERLQVSIRSVGKHRRLRQIPAFLQSGGVVVATPDLVELLHLPTSIVRRRSGLSCDPIERLRDELDIRPLMIGMYRRIAARVDERSDREIARSLRVPVRYVRAVRRWHG